MQKILIVDKHDHLATGLAAEQMAMLLSGVDAELMLEPTTLDDINLSYLPESLVDNSDNMLLSAITTKRLRLDRTMKALLRGLNSQLSASDLTAGALPDAEISSPGAKVIGGAIVAKPRKSGLIATLTAELPISDGQSVFIIFHAPDDDPGVIQADDTLIAFRFLLNKRDITDIVAPHNGRDISLKQTTLALANAIEKNSRKFQAGLKVRQQMAQELEGEQSKLDDSIARISEHSEAAMALRETAEKSNSETLSYGERLARQKEINSQLEKDLELMRSRQQSNVVQFPDKSKTAENLVDAIDSANKEPAAAPVQSEKAPADNYQKKYEGNYTGDKYAQNKDLPFTELTKKIRLAITAAKKDGTFPADLRVSVTQNGRAIRMEIQALPDGFNVYSDDYVSQYVDTGSYPSGVDGLKRYADNFSALKDRLSDEANQYNMNDSDSMTDLFNQHFFTTVTTSSIIESASLNRQSEQYRAEKAAAEVQDNQQAAEPEKLPEPSAYRDGSESKPIELEFDRLQPLGQAEITSIGDENIYVLKDGLHYYSKVLNTEEYRVGPWDFTKNSAENLSMENQDMQSFAFTPAHEMTRESWIKEQIENGDYAEEYLNDRELYDDKAETIKNDWAKALEEQAKTGRISTVALDDYVTLFGIDALVSKFRGTLAAGIAGYEPPFNRLWDLTYAQVLRLSRSGAIDPVLGNVKELHRTAIKRALKSGEAVPERVMKDYPELMEQSGELEGDAEGASQSAEEAAAVVEAAAAEPVDIPAAAGADTTEELPEPAVGTEPSPADLGINPEILAAQADLDSMRKQQERMKKANALVRTYEKAKAKDAEKAMADLLKGMKEIGFGEATISKLLTPNYMGRVVAFEAYELTNLNARIKSREERIAELEKRDELADQGDMEFDFTINGAPVTVEVDLDADRIRVSFPRLTGKAKESDPEYGMVQKIGRGANWSPSNRAWQRKITTNAQADIAYSLDFKGWKDLVAKGRLAQQEANAQDAVTDPVQPEQAQPEQVPEPVNQQLPAVQALREAVGSESDADKLMDMLDAVFAEIESAGADESEYAELIQQASDRITALLEAA